MSDGDRGRPNGSLPHRPSRADKFYLFVFSFLDLVAPSAVLIGIVRSYALPALAVVWAVLSVRIVKFVRLEADGSRMLVVNRYRTISIEAPAIQQIKLKRIALGQGPFAVTVRRETDNALRRFFGGLRIEATASYSRSVNSSLAALEHLFRTSR